jgi:hypothetical protein
MGGNITVRVIFNGKNLGYETLVEVHSAECTLSIARFHERRRSQTPISSCIYLHNGNGKYLDHSMTFKEAKFKHMDNIYVVEDFIYLHDGNGIHLFDSRTCKTTKSKQTDDIRAVEDSSNKNQTNTLGEILIFCLMSVIMFSFPIYLLYKI